MMTKYTITATYADASGTRLAADRHYALGDYACTVFDSQEEAEEIADQLRSDVGDVVDETIKYEVVVYAD